MSHDAGIVFILCRRFPGASGARMGGPGSIKFNFSFKQLVGRGRVFG